jgi:hypothetical protein
MPAWIRPSVQAMTAAPEIVTTFIRKLLMRTTITDRAGSPMMLAVPSQTGKMANWTAAATL